MKLTSRIKYKIERTYVDTLFFLSLERILFSGKKVNKILMYHGVDLFEEKKFNSRFIGIENFERQILFLKKHTNIISVQDFFDGKFDNSKSNIAITFDDGYLNNYKYVFPFLNEVKVNATIYVTALNLTEYDILWPDFIDLASYFSNNPIEIDDAVYTKNTYGKYFSKEKGMTLNEVIKQRGGFEFKKKVIKVLGENSVDFKKMEHLTDYWKLMSDEQLKEVDKSKYVSIESHAFWHNNLGNISLTDSKKELVDSKNYLENLLQREVKELAYPDGCYTRDLINMAESIGFKYQLATEIYKSYEDVNDPRIHDRVGLYPTVSWCNQMFDLINKNYERRI